MNHSLYSSKSAFDLTHDASYEQQIIESTTSNFRAAEKKGYPKRCFELLPFGTTLFFRSPQWPFVMAICHSMMNRREEERLKMGKRVIIDEEECIGCESCVELCPKVFVFNEDTEKAEVILPEGGPAECIEESIDTCPVECIHWEED